MKKITVKVITISSQILVVLLFLASLFYSVGNDKVTVINNDNLIKMADSTSSLFKEEESITSLINDDALILLDDNTGTENLNEVLSTEEVNNIQSNTNNEINEDTHEENRVSLENPIIETHVGNLTGYGADCDGCSGITASGFDLTKTMYYDDSEYGTVRILAADPMFSFYSIFRINVPGMEPFIGIVLDRGSNVGYGRGTLFDLAYLSENDPELIGLTKNVTFELLRSGK